MRLLSAVFAALVLALLYPLAVRAQPASPKPSLSVPRLVNFSGVFQPADGLPRAPVEVVTLKINTNPGSNAINQPNREVLAEREVRDLRARPAQ